MPCRRDDDYPEDARWSAAFLCAILTVTDALGNTDHVLDRIESSDAGINASHIRLWWKQHKEADARRKANEARLAELERQRKEKIALALAKLTDEEKALFNLRK